MEITKRIDYVFKKVYRLFGVEHSDLILEVEERAAVDVLHREVKTVLFLE